MAAAQETVYDETISLEVAGALGSAGGSVTIGPPPSTEDVRSAED